MWPRTSGSFQAWRQQKQEQWGGQPRQEQGGRYSGGNLGWGGGWGKELNHPNPMGFSWWLDWVMWGCLPDWSLLLWMVTWLIFARSKLLVAVLVWGSRERKWMSWWLVNKLYIGEWIAAGCEGHKRAVIASIHQLSPPPLNMYHQICNVFLQRVFLKCTEKRRILNSHYFRFSVLKPHWRKGREYYNSVNPI